MRIVSKRDALAAAVGLRAGFGRAGGLVRVAVGIAPFAL